LKAETLVKRPTIDEQLQSGWNSLYTIEADEEILEEKILSYLGRAADCIAQVRSRKRLSKRQREKLNNLEKWYNLYDLNRIRQKI
jgi:hypothetical protein